MFRPPYLTSEDEAVLLSKVKDLHLKIGKDSPQKIVEIDQKTIGLSRSVLILIVNGDWYILHPQEYDGRLCDASYRWEYKIEFSADETALPTISDKPYIIKKTVPSLDTQLADLKEELEITRTFLDSDASEVWLDPETNNACEAAKNASHFYVMKVPQGIQLQEYCAQFTKGLGPVLAEGFDLALSTINQIQKVHDTGRILGTLDNYGTYYNQKTQEILFVDYCCSVRFNTPIRKSMHKDQLPPEDRQTYMQNKEAVLARADFDIYALGRNRSPLTYFFSSSSSNDSVEDWKFKTGLRTYYMQYYLANDRERPSLNQAYTVLNNLKLAYEDEIERDRFLRITAALDQIIIKINWLCDGPDNDEAAAALRKEKLSIFIKFRENIVSRVMNCYLGKPGTKPFLESLNALCCDLQSHDWSKDEATAKLYNRRSFSGLYADIVLGGLLIGLIPMLIKALNAARQGKSFIQNFCLFSEIKSVTVLENFVYEDMPRLTGTK